MVKGILKKAVSLALAAVLMASALTGCTGDQKGSDTNAEDSEKNQAKGRYLEEDIKLPEGTDQILDVVRLEDGGLKIAVMDARKKSSVWESRDEAETWKKVYDFPKEAGSFGNYESAAALSPKGELACATVKEGTNGTMLHQYWVIDAQGNAKELKVELPADGLAGGSSVSSGGTEISAEEDGEEETSGGQDDSFRFSQEKSAGEEKNEAAPEGGMQVPEGEVQAPEGETQAPEGETQAPEGEVQAPESTAQNLQGYSMENSIIRMKFAQDGTLIVQDIAGKLYKLDTKTGELGQKFGDDNSTEFTQGFDTAGSRLIVLTTGEVQIYDIASGKRQEKDSALSDQILKGMNNENATSILDQFLAADGKNENEMFFCSKEGIYSHAIGGNMVEQVVNGALNSLSSPILTMLAMETLGENSFLVAGKEQDTYKLYKYTYDKDAPTTPSKEIKVYSLKDSQELRQAIAFYQKKNPDVYVSLEIGVQGEDAVTVSDALRTLNTNILAGKGPDVLILDGMPLNSYMEKGLLADLSGILKEAGLDGKLFENIGKHYEKDGKLLAMPLRFMIPLIQGNKEDTDAVHDLKSLVERAEKIKSENPDVKQILGNYNIEDFSNLLYNISSPAWSKDDGTMDQDKLREFFRQMKKLYNVDSHEEEKFAVSITMASEEGQGEMNSLSILNGVFPFISEEKRMNLGLLGSAFEYAYVNGGNKAIGSGAAKVLEGQAEHVFLPSITIGLSSKSTQTEEAGKFIAYLFSNEAQSINQGGGFPVNQEAFKAALDLEERLADNTGVFFTTMTNKVIDLNLETPTAEETEALSKWVESLTTPVLDDEVIKSAVLEQAEQLLNGTVTEEQAADNVIQKINLYLSE